MIEQPRDPSFVERGGSSVKWRASFGICGSCQRRIGLQHPERPATLPHAGAEYAGGSGNGTGSGLGLAPALLFIPNYGNDLVVPAIAGERERTGGLAMWIDPGMGIGSVLHEQPRHLGGAKQDGIMDRAMLVSSDTHVYQLRACAEHGLDAD